MFFYCTWMLVMDCRFVGVLYMFLSILGGCLGFGFSVQMRGELLYPFSVYGDEIFYVCITAHAVLMVFFFLTTLATGFSNFFIPGMFGVVDFFFPRLNSLSFWMVLLSGLFLVFSLLVGNGVSTGWTAYPPLSNYGFSEGGSIEMFIMAVHLFTVSTVLSSINIICTVFYSKLYYLDWLDVSVYVWSIVVTSFLNVASLPYFSSSVTMLFLDRNFNCVFFDPSYGGDPLLYQSLFWFWGHPEVYILIIPVFGLVALIMCNLLDVEYLFGSYCMVISIMSVSVLGFIVWGHHMVTVGWSLDIRVFFMVATVVISLPTGLKVFNWICSVYFYLVKDLLLEICYYYIFSFVVVFIFGGVTGVMLANSTLDVIFHDSYFVVGHFHYILSLAAVSGYFCLFYYSWGSIIGGGDIDFTFGIIHLGLFMSSANVCFFPFHLLGLAGLPRRVSCYPEVFFPSFYFSSCGFLFVALSVFVFFSGILYSIN
uniref:cytochrome c oxidase subunit I n=1 Tax=Sphaeromyxa zaharoni TaxID=275449 RepID=UPI00300339D2